MKKLFVESVGMVFMIFCIPVYVWADNAVFNPGFDMSPWDSGWTIEIDTVSGSGSCTVMSEAEVESDSGRSFPNRCYLRTYTKAECPGGGGSGWGKAKATMTQNFEGLTGCMIKAYVKWKLIPAVTCEREVYGNIQCCINNEWKIIWENSIEDWDHPTWTKICTTLIDDDTLSGIKLCAFSYFNGNCILSSSVKSELWVDDIYVGKAGIEESEELRVKSLEFRVYPNPFTEHIAIKLSSNQAIREKVKVYDMMGRLVEETNKNVVGKSLPAGVYFVKIKGYKPVKIIKLMEVL